MKSERGDFVGPRELKRNFNCEPVEQNIRIQDYKPAAVSERLTAVSAYYQDESQGRYAPQYTWVGAVAPGPASDDSDCQNPAASATGPMATADAP